MPLGTEVGLGPSDINDAIVEHLETNSLLDKNSSGDEIANVNFFYNIAHVEASDYAH